MCFCDGKYFMITNKSTGENHLIDGNEGLHSFFDGYYSIAHLFHKYMKKEQIKFKDNFYVISINFHLECEQVKRDLIKKYGKSEKYVNPELWWGRCPDEYRYLLPPEKQ